VARRCVNTPGLDEDGRPTFPALHERNVAGKPVNVPRGSIPSMHSFRHTVASRALLAGESVDEIAFLLGHRDANVTRAVYVRELADTRRRAMRRTRMAAEFDGALQAGAEEDPLDPRPRPRDGQVHELRGGPSAAAPARALMEA
jgi:hypothetical protein